MSTTSNDKMMTPVELYNKIRKWEDAVSEEKGMNMDYCTCMDFDCLPHVIVAMMTWDEIVENVSDVYDDEDGLSALQFLAENGRLLPKSLQEADYPAFVKYINENSASLMKQIEKILHGYYEDTVRED